MKIILYFKHIIFCKINQHLSREVHSRALLQYDGNSNDSEYNQLPTAVKTKAPNICQLLVRENGVRLVEGHDNNKGGKFTCLLKPYILNYFYFISGGNLCRSVAQTYKNVCVYSRSSHWRCSRKKGVLKN